jgi:hypothetical protein
MRCLFHVVLQRVNFLSGALLELLRFTKEVALRQLFRGGECLVE